ncbi:MAG: NAD(P)H-dependent oxidoreductase subunit E [Gemmatimonadaceae bacterium]|nr:NAD(P)H-dependent oxidoreductase subunit E [Gemmatimonadaceae bacterium]
MSIENSVSADDELAILHQLFAATPARASYLLPLLQQVQARVGFVSQAAMRAVAAHVNVSRAEVYGVVSFYHDLREEPVGDTVVQVCMAEACQAVGCRDLALHVERRRGVALGTIVDGQSWHAEATYCLGNCALGPSVRIGDAIHGRVTPERLDALLADEVRS